MTRAAQVTGDRIWQRSNLRNAFVGSAAKACGATGKVNGDSDSANAREDHLEKMEPQAEENKEKNFPRPGAICLFHGQIASAANQNAP